MAKAKGAMVDVANDWQVEDDLRTLQRAMEIKKDPKRMAKVKELAKMRLEENAHVVGQVADSEKSA